MFDLSFQYPAWFLVFCALLGLGYASLLYFRDTTFREQAPNLHRLLAVLRFIVITVLSALLLSPLLKRLITETKKPILVFAQDESESIASAVTGETLEKYKQNWQAIRSELSADFEVRELAFGDAVREGVDFKLADKATNLSEALRGLYDLYSGQNLGAVILATDGIYNEGSNPAYTDTKLNAPVYTVALGDTVPKRDLLVKRVFHNKIAYLGDRFAIQIDVAATNCAGSSSALTVSRVDADGTKQLQSIPIAIGSNDFFTTQQVEIEADKPGVSQYRISLARVNGEVSTVNNVRDIFIDVLDARQKILLLANAPHPDLTTLKQMLDANKNYQVTVAYISTPGLDVSPYDFVVLHNLPSVTNDASTVFSVLNTKRTPRLFISGLQTNFAALNNAQALVNTAGNNQQTDDVQGKVDARFATFTISPRLADELPKFNPVVSSFGEFSATPQAQVLLWKRIGRIDTEQPLLAVGETNGIRTGVFLAEGLWKWRLFDYLQHQNHEIFDELFGKTIQYLSLKEDKRRFRVTTGQSVFKENDPVIFGAELYNENYELVNDPDVSLSVRNSDGREFTYTFAKQGKGYTLNAGILPVGSYTFRAATTFNGQQLSFDGRFAVQAIQLELFETVADHDLLRRISTASGGETVGPDQFNTLIEKIRANKSVKPVIYSSNQTNPLINLKWIFAILAALLVLEWFLRRYFGAY